MNSKRPFSGNPKSKSFAERDKSKSHNSSINLTPKKNKVICSYLDSRHEKEQEKIIQLRDAKYKKLMNEMRQTPQINPNSRRIVDKLRRDNSNSKINQTVYTTQTTVSDYAEILNNRKKKLQEIEMRNSNRTSKTNINRNSSRTSVRFTSKTKTCQAYKPIIKKEKTQNIYTKYNEKAVMDVRKKLHDYYNKGMASHQNVIHTDIQSCPRDSAKFPLFNTFKPIEDEKNDRNEKGFLDQAFKKVSCRTQEYQESSENLFILGSRDEKKVKGEINIQNQLEEENPENENSNDHSNILVNNNVNVTNHTNASAANRELPSNLKKEQISKPNNFFNKRSNTTDRGMIEQRENDLKKFMMFTEEFTKGDSVRGEKEFWKKPIEVKGKFVASAVKPQPKIINKLIDLTASQSQNMFSGKREPKLNDMKLNAGMKAFAEEKLREMRKNMQKNS